MYPIILLAVSSYIAGGLTDQIYRVGFTLSSSVFLGCMVLLAIGSVFAIGR